MLSPGPPAFATSPVNCIGVTRRYSWANGKQHWTVKLDTPGDKLSLMFSGEKPVLTRRLPNRTKRVGRVKTLHEAVQELVRE